MDEQCPLCHSVDINSFCTNCRTHWNCFGRVIDLGEVKAFDFRIAANDLSPKDRQALYEYLYNAHGCRIR